MATSGVLLTAFGGPDSLDAVRPFMCNLMGREPSDELVERVCRRYLAIGGASPLPEIAAGIANRLAEFLSEAGTPAPVEVGMRYWDPFIADGLKRLVDQGCDRVVLASLSPFESKVASGACREAVLAAVEEMGGGIEVVEAPLAGDLDEFAEFLAGATAASIEQLEPNEGVIVAFTAHSLPEADLVENDPYVEGLTRLASYVAAQLGMADGQPDAGAPMFERFRSFGTAQAPRAWFLAYQSKGNKPGAWLGPELEDLIDEAAEVGVSGIVVCPIGFMTDHMETLYDLDIVAADRALTLGLEFMRAPVPNDDDNVVEAYARKISALI